MLSELNRRFNYIFDDLDEHFDGSFLLATALDPNLRQYLNQEHLEIIRNSLKDTLLSLVMIFDFFLILRKTQLII